MNVPEKTPPVTERILAPISGIPMLVANLLGLLLACGMIAFACVEIDKRGATNLGDMAMLFISVVVMIPFCCINFNGLKLVAPNEALVLTLFGTYYGTISKAGFFYVNPFSSAYNPAKTSAIASAAQTAASLAGSSGEEANNKDSTSGKKISMKAITLNNRTQKVNDLEGNPIEIGAMVIWKVHSPSTAVFAVDNYLEYISMQADATLRAVACQYAYDHGEDPDPNQLTLRKNSDEIALLLQDLLHQKVSGAGLEVVEVKITHLAYASEIAAAMLQRQQASAILSARRLIVEGAVGMVQQALAKLDQENIVELDDERKATMISNLLVVLCANKEAQPVVNSGSIY